VLLGVGSVGLLLVCGLCGGLVWWAGSSPTASAAAREPFELASIAPPYFPERGAPTQIEPNIDFYEISLGAQGGFYSPPGNGGKIWLYLPSGTHPAGSLKCIAIAGAGSTMLHGMDLGDGDRPEHLPYVRAGMAVVAYEMDGPPPGEDERSMQVSYEAFRASRAGMVNLRNAVDFALARVPEIDPRRIYSAGHSSAASTSLLAAAHEPRLAGCIAFAPCCDVTNDMNSEIPGGVRMYGMLMPGLADFLVQSSPNTHQERIRGSVYVFHTQDDLACAFADTATLVNRLRARGVDVTFDSPPSGDHYQAMIDHGIPGAIAWLRRQY
jgi:dienelactone hydrolase